MATETLEAPTQEEIPEPIADRTDAEKGVKLVFDRHIAHEGLMIDRMNRQLHASERMQKFAATGDVKDLEAPEEDESMGVNIGNEYHNHYQVTESPKGEPTPSPEATAETAETAASGAGKYLATAALGGALVVAGNLLNAWWQQPDPPAVSQPADVNYKLGVTVSD